MERVSSSGNIFGGSGGMDLILRTSSEEVDDRII